MSTCNAYFICQVCRVHFVVFWTLPLLPWLTSSSKQPQSEGDLVCCLESPFVKANKKSRPRLDKDRTCNLGMDTAESVELHFPGKTDFFFQHSSSAKKIFYGLCYTHSFSHTYCHLSTVHITVSVNYRAILTQKPNLINSDRSIKKKSNK